MDPDKIHGNFQRPYNPQEPEQSDKIDPEKFKRVMKIEDTDEAQKRNKRNLRKEEEEGEDEEVEGETTPPPTDGTFAEFMSDKEELDNLFDKQSGGVRYQTSPEDESFVAPGSGKISTEGVEIEEETPSKQQMPRAKEGVSQGPFEEKAPPERQAPTEEPSSPPLYEGEDIQEPPPSAQDTFPSSGKGQQQEESPPPSQGEKNPIQTSQEPSSKQKEGGKEEDSSLLASQPGLHELKPKKKKGKAQKTAEIKPLSSEEEKGEKTPQEAKGKKGVKVEETPIPELKEGKTKASHTPLHKETEEIQKGEEGKIPLGALPKEEQPAELKKSAEEAPQKMETPFRRLTPQEVRKERIGKEGEVATSDIQGMDIPPLGEGGQGEMGGEKKKDKDEEGYFIEATPDTASISLPSFDPPILAASQTEAPPSYTKLNPEVHELFEKMGGVMMIQVDKGVTTTTMDINLPNSVFNGAQIILEQYSSAPHSFNLQLVGSPEAVKLFNQNIKDLDQSFKQANFNFDVNILNPILSKEKKSPHLIRRGGSTGGKGGKGGKEKGKEG
ncbi:MAG: hypothetical protein KDK76_07960 [Chlamydiia bacterium]|nr:hypothetical protein [Chlamydiia bacterium]